MSNCDAYQVADDADGIVQTALGLLDDLMQRVEWIQGISIGSNHLVAAANEDGDGLGVLALLNHKHAILRKIWAKKK